MTLFIDPERLKQIRKLRGLSQAALAKKAHLDKQTIYRMERERRPIRQTNLDHLARALDVVPGGLTGEEPVPDDFGQRGTPEVESGYQLNVRVDGQVRNAFSLASLHYRVPVRRIVELAPLLFVLAAEGSLRRRRERLADLEAALDRVSHDWSRIPHFPTAAAESNDHWQIIEAEKKSIAARDLFADWEFGSELEDRNDLYEGYDSSKKNPFVFYLHELMQTSDEALIQPWGDYWERFDVPLQYVDYGVCWSEAVELAGGDPRLAAAVYFGLVPIHEMPRNLQLPLDRPRAARWTAEGNRQRIEWLRQQAESNNDLLAQVMEDPPEWMRERGVWPILPKWLLLKLASGDEELAERLANAIQHRRVRLDDLPSPIRPVWVLKDMELGPELAARWVDWIRSIQEPEAVRPNPPLDCADQV